MIENELPYHEVGHQLGMQLEATTEGIWVERRGIAALIDRRALPSPQHARARATGAWALYGIRLGLDYHHARQARPPRSPGFRRTAVQRYHEAPPFYGDHILHLVPRWTRRWFEAVSGAPALHRDALDTGGALEEVILKETGLRLDLLTQNAQDASDVDGATRWKNARTALFYNSYKIRGQTSRNHPGVRLRTLHTTEGFAASRSLILPEFDYDSAQDGAFIALPTRDHFLIAAPAPADNDNRDASKESLQESLTKHFNAHPFPLTDAIWRLDREALHLCVAPERWPGQGLDTPDNLLIARRGTEAQ
ncbi:hypothetical protein DL240_05360 [Lujinxingia litoralis]|uniref:Uncharacterized protein n=1 Tax=Lujinxingia litoralis TaxID=2211119 RepID=A0A328C9H3_9DELT|nr:hypothetical protein [Lujinxingia litoralis]RAL23588.1 hypothetical protein DL240_05360 [Lujinxingia litoralis]